MSIVKKIKDTIQDYKNRPYEVKEYNKGRLMAGVGKGLALFSGGVAAAGTAATMLGAPTEYTIASVPLGIASAYAGVKLMKKGEAKMDKHDEANFRYEYGPPPQDSLPVTKKARYAAKE